MPAPWETEGLDELYFYSRIKVRQWIGESIAALVIEGHLGLEGAAEEFVALLTKAAAEPVRGVVLDMRKVTHLPSKILPPLVSLRQQVAKKGGIVAVVAPSERINRLLGLVGMEKAIFITSDPEEAYEAARKASGRWDSPEEQD
jgi:anti-anti-sigma factor